MGWKAEHRAAYEERVIDDAIARLLATVDRGDLPLSDDELRTLARRARERFRKRSKGEDRLERYRRHLEAVHGRNVLDGLVRRLEAINNQIGYEEK